VMSIEMETLVVELIGKCYYGRVAEPLGARPSHPLAAPGIAHAPRPLA
jgi:hypothetical protein